MPQFEYKTLISDADDETDEQSLNALGAEGWELVSAIADVRASEDIDNPEENVPVTAFYFKRQC